VSESQEDTSGTAALDGAFTDDTVDVKEETAGEVAVNESITVHQEVGTGTAEPDPTAPLPEEIDPGTQQQDDEDQGYSGP